MSASLAASTVTPGITAPDVSLTTPAIAVGSVWARLGADRNHSAPTANTPTFAIRTISCLLIIPSDGLRRDGRSRRVIKRESRSSTRIGVAIYERPRCEDRG